MFTGARREELCNLYQDDIKKEDGVWYIDITADKPGKRIKTYQIRTASIHPFVLELGFLEFVETFQKGQRLPGILETFRCEWAFLSGIVTGSYSHLGNDFILLCILVTVLLVPIQSCINTR